MIDYYKWVVRWPLLVLTVSVSLLGLLERRIDQHVINIEPLTPNVVKKAPAPVQRDHLVRHYPSVTSVTVPRVMDRPEGVDSVWGGQRRERRRRLLPSSSLLGREP